jgi:hypothetical protein
MSHSPPTSSFSYDQSIANATTRAIELALYPGTSDGDDRLGDALRQLCSDARHRGTRPEELIILLKTAWRAHIELRAVPRGEADSALEHLISTCIEEYYRSGLGH